MDGLWCIICLELRNKKIFLRKNVKIVKCFRYTKKNFDPLGSTDIEVIVVAKDEVEAKEILSTKEQFDWRLGEFVELGEGVHVITLMR